MYIHVHVYSLYILTVKLNYYLLKIQNLTFLGDNYDTNILSTNQLKYKIFLIICIVDFVVNHNIIFK